MEDSTDSDSPVEIDEPAKLEPNNYVWVKIFYRKDFDRN